MGGHRRAPTRGVLFVVVAILLALAAGVGAFAFVRAELGSSRAIAQATPSPTPTRRPTPSALASALLTPSSATSAPAEPSAATIAAQLAGPLASRALGKSVLAEVVDAATGDLLYGRGAATPAPPASTAKLATAAAVLSVHASTDRITTSVVAGAAAGTIVLVGGGDPMLSAVVSGATPYPDAARISSLATQLRAAHVAVSKVVVDDSLFTGPAVSPSWLPADVPSSYASAITALMVDGGRNSPAATVRSRSPDLAAGDALAADLGLPSRAVSRGAAPAGAITLASVHSATYGELVDQMLQQSDNVIAECLARQVALARSAPASFAGAAAAVRTVLAGLGVDIGPGMTDGSGLSPSDRLTPSSLVGLLRLALSDAHPALGDVVADLPVAAWDGTLAGRYKSGPARAGAGLVRAKTGTLTSVSTLAGIVTTSDGRVLVFSFVAAAVGPTVADTSAAEAALDVMAAALVAS